MVRGNIKRDESIPIDFDEEFDRRVYQKHCEKPCEELLTLVAGGLGRWQWFTTLIMGIMLVPSGINTILFYYLAPPWQKYWCISFKINDAEQQCFLKTSHGIQYCTKWNYSQALGFTIIEKWQFVCGGEKFVNVYRTFERISSALGFIIVGTLADWYGRRTVLLICLLLQSILGIISAFVDNFVLFIIVRCLFISILCGTDPIGIVYVCEAIGNKRRSLMMSLLMLFYGFGLVLIPLLFHYHIINDYRKLLLLASSPQILFLILIYYSVCESPVWLLATQRVSRAEEVLRTIAETNGHHTPSCFRICLLLVTNYPSVRENRTDLFALFLHRSTSLMSVAIWSLWFLIYIVWIFSHRTAMILIEDYEINFSILLFTITSWLGFASYSLYLLIFQDSQKHHIPVIWIGCTIACLVTSLAVLLDKDKDKYRNVHSGMCYGSIYLCAITITALWNMTPRLFPTELRGTCTGYAYAGSAFGILLGVWLWPHTIQNLSSEWPEFFEFHAHDIIIAAILIIIGITVFCLTYLLFYVENRELPDQVLDTWDFQNKRKPQRWTALRRKASPTIDETEVNTIDMSNVSERRLSAALNYTAETTTIFNRLKQSMSKLFYKSLRYPSEETIFYMPPTYSLGSDLTITTLVSDSIPTSSFKN